MFVLLVVVVVAGVREVFEVLWEGWECRDCRVLGVLRFVVALHEQDDNQARARVSLGLRRPHGN
ncbi:hypothetical protein [Kitasatospora azatica]|uniref:hypothetical protein n=1 Tax=Kitasatospora azatica TaxID=58347 RepID=UPI0012F90A23|nr:hypothetical protein [Kitasatospora azatica]